MTDTPTISPDAPTIKRPKLDVRTAGDIARQVVVLGSIGAMIGSIVALVLGGRMMTWFIGLPASSSLCNCQEAAQRTAAALLEAQLIGGLCGGALLVALGEVWVRWRRRRAT